jgi:hypothetical protein
MTIIAIPLANLPLANLFIFPSFPNDLAPGGFSRAFLDALSLVSSRPVESRLPPVKRLPPR